MHKSFQFSMVVFSTVVAAALFDCLVFLPAVFAQSGAGTPPDLSGIWQRTRDGGRIVGVFGNEPPPMRPEAKRIYDENRGGPSVKDEDGLDGMDPSTYCLPHGTPRAYTVSYPFEIIQLPDKVHILYESSLMRRQIFLDGRKMPDGYPPSYMGYSTGRYDGDTLVVETAGLDPETWIDTRGVPHSGDLKITERLRRAAPDKLEIAFRFDDPKTFTRPWGATLNFALHPDFEIMEHIGYCEDRFRYNFEHKIYRGNRNWASPEKAAGVSQ